MKNKRRLFLGGTLIIGMAFSLGLAGCPSTIAAEDPTAVELAAQLAADLNAIEAGSATVNGATVTLTGDFVNIASDLTVPAGVTLDVTAHGAALGLHNATLTVNGTVNTTFDFGDSPSGDSWEAPSIRLEDSASWAIINGSGTIYLKGKGHLFEVSGNINVANRKLTLDGVTLVGVEDNDSSLVEIGEGGEFILKSGVITGNTRTSDELGAGGGVSVWQGKFTMEGGTISGNNAVRTRAGVGGGVAVGGENATFTMEGGAITGNSAFGNEGAAGGGVIIEESAFTMTGGEISGNSTTGTIWSNGSGVKLGQGATFTMRGGAISNNTATCDDYSEGGGVMVEDGATFTMEGGTISGNSARSNGGENNGGSGGAGVSVWDNGVFTMKDGQISGNSAQSNGGGVLVGEATFIMEGGTISGNTVGDGGGVTVAQNATFTMKGGAIYGNTAEWGGGGVNVNNGSIFIMEGGAISGNTANWGGGVAVDESMFTMIGGRIQGGTDSDGFSANIVTDGDNEWWNIALWVGHGTAKWGTGGTYTGGESQTGGSNIVSLDDDYGGTDGTLIAIPAE